MGGPGCPVRPRGCSAGGGGDLSGEVLLALVVGDDGGDGDLLIGGDRGGGPGAGEDLLGAVGVLDVPVDARDRAVGVGGGRGVQGQLVTIAGEGEGAGRASVVHLCLSRGGLLLRGLPIVQSVHDRGGHGFVPGGVGVEASVVEQAVEPGGLLAAQLVASEGAGGVGELVSVALGGGPESGVELVGLGVDPALIHLGDALAAPRNREDLFGSLRGEHARVADGDDGCVRCASGDVRHERVIAGDARARALACQSVDGAVDLPGDLLVAGAVGEGSGGDALGEDGGETGVVTSDGEGDQTRGGVQAVELSGLVPGGPGLVEVRGAGS